MNQIASLLPLDNVVANLDASSKKRVFEQAGILFENHQSVARSTVYDALFAREKLGSTGPRPGHRHSPWTHQGPQDAGRRLCPPRIAGAVRRARRQAGRTGIRAAGTGSRQRASPAIALRTGADVLRQGLSRPARRGSGCAGTTRPLRQLARQLVVSQLFERNRERLQLSWVSGAMTRAICTIGTRGVACRPDRPPQPDASGTPAGHRHAGSRLVGPPRAGKNHASHAGNLQRPAARHHRCRRLSDCH